MYDSGNQAGAVNMIDSVYRQSDDLTLKEKFSYYILRYNYLYHKKHRLDSAMLYADSILSVFNTPEKRFKYNFEYGQAHFFKGDVLFDDNRYNEAYRYYYQGKVIASSSMNACIVGDYSYRMGMIMYKQGHYSAAAANFKNAFVENGNCSLTFRSFYRSQELLDNAGISYSKIQKDDSAMYFFKKALTFIDTHKTRFKASTNLLDAARGVIYGNQADVYIREKNYQLAKDLLKKSFKINLHKGNDNVDAQLSELKLAHIYYAQKQTDSLYQLLQNVKIQSDTIKSQGIQADWNYLMSRYYLSKSDPATALYYFKVYDSLKDSIAAKQKSLIEADVNEQINRLEKNHEFDKLQKNNQLQKVTLKAIIIIGVLFLVMLFLIYSNWFHSRRTIKKLGELNMHINEQNTTLSSALNELEISNQEKDRILRAVAHDLRNPIGGISSIVSMMGPDARNDGEKEAINLIKETSNNSLALINEILEATKDGKSNLQREKTEIGQLVGNSAELLRFKAAEKDQQIISNLPDKAIELTVNREKIWRVIGNILSNAIKFSPKGSTIWVAVKATETDVVISVKDEGIGVPDNLDGSIFNMFTDAKRPGTDGENSFGLGLSICKQIIENHGGSIWFEKNTDKGTTFFISLKRKQA